MELPSITIQRLKKWTNTSTLTSRNLTWFKNHYYTNRDEKGILEFNPRNDKFIIGKCYTFFYFNPKYKDELEFWNSVPVGVFIGYHQTSKNPMFLALMFIPPKIRLKILDKIVTINASKIDHSNNQLITKGTSNIMLDTRYQDLKKYLAKSGFEFAIRSYILTRINSKPLIITNHDWWRLATFPSKFVMKKDLRAIYIMYKQAIGINQFRKGGEKEINI